MRPREDEPNAIRNQAPLQTATGTIWLVVGGLLSLIAIVVFALLLGFDPPGLAAAGIAADVVVYVAMVVIRYAVPPGRARLAGLAVGMLLMAALSLACALVIAASIR